MCAHSAPRAARTHVTLRLCATVLCVQYTHRTAPRSPGYIHANERYSTRLQALHAWVLRPPYLRYSTVLVTHASMETTNGRITYFTSDLNLLTKASSSPRNSRPDLLYSKHCCSSGMPLTPVLAHVPLGACLGCSLCSPWVASWCRHS